MEITIEKAGREHLGRLMEIFDCARRFMQANGNAGQWTNGYPQRELMAREIDAGHCYICRDGSGRIAGTFCFSTGEDPTYLRIEDGEWLNTHDTYSVIHRIASDGSCKNLFAHCLAWCAGHSTNIRIDTHADNSVMRHLLQKHGFTRCGIIYTLAGSPRIAYQRVGISSADSIVI